MLSLTSYFFFSQEKINNAFEQYPDTDQANC